jgi:CRP-like cAMP-binding protein
MAEQTLNRSDFKETYAVHAALRSGLKSKLFVKDASAKKAAERLLKTLESEKTIYGRQCKMIRLMQKGATIAELQKGLNCSRRTVFRYFLDLENADINIRLEGAKYFVDKGLLQLV